ncbi:MAG: hypothetical protein IPN84_09565 [Sphingomonadales bacterium]|jgi:preprotein translocase subunit SecD|nr:hypothetical protein [Sphingomonadales bacterium]
MPSRWIMRGAALALSLAVPEALIAKDAPGALWFGTENFTPADIIDARAQPDLDGHVSVLVTLEEPASARLAALTRDHVGKPVPLIYQGREIVAPVIHEPITGGSFQLSGNFTMEEAKQIALDISGKPPLADSLEEE